MRAWSGKSGTYEVTAVEIDSVGHKKYMICVEHAMELGGDLRLISYLGNIISKLEAIFEQMALYGLQT